MSDKNNNPNAPLGCSGKEPALSELISSSKKELEKAKHAPASSTDSKASEAAGRPAEPPKKTDKPDIAKKSNITDVTDRSDMPEISFKVSGAAAQKKPAAIPASANTAEPPKKDRNVDEAADKTDKDNKTKSGKPSNGKNDAAEKNKTASSAKAPSEKDDKQKAKKTQNQTTVKHDIKKSATPKDVVSDKTSNRINEQKNVKKDKADNGKGNPTKAAEKKKGKFTAKQIGTVVGLIASLLLVLALIVLLIFNHYFGLLGGKQTDISNSEPMTYSDVDLSRADTIDKVSEDEKLKELLGKGEKISNKDVMNILLIGEDLRDTQSESAGNTDVMMILSINTKDKTITMTSVMRDCYVNFQTDDGYWYSTRINAAYWHGGVKLTKQTIENYLNVKIDRYVLVNFKVFIDIVDTLGGLDMTVTDEEANGYPGADPNGDNTRGMQNPLDEQNKYLGNKKGTDYIKKGGKLHLNGNQALAYARLRHVGNSDYERTERQRKVISQMIKKSRDLSLVDMDRLANKILPQIKTDVSKTETAQLLVDMLDYRNYEIQEFRVPADGTFTDQVISGMDVLQVDFNANAQMFRELVYGSIEVDESGNETDMAIE